MFMFVPSIASIGCKSQPEIVQSEAEWGKLVGEVLIAPTCPVEQSSLKCPPQPYQAEILVLTEAEGKVVATLKSDPAGRFEILLAPGFYRLRPLPPSQGESPLAPPEITIEVLKGRETLVRIVYDSGLR
jgi:hypothetical protein